MERVPWGGLARGRRRTRTGGALGPQAVALGVRRERELSELWALSPRLSGHRASQRRSPLDSGKDRGVGRRDRALSAAGGPAWRDDEDGAGTINDSKTRRPDIMRGTGGMTNRASWWSTSRRRK